MMLPNKKTYIYEKSQLVEVICQLRFPAILSIEANEPAQFQDMIRENFPKYNLQIENLPPQNGSVQQVKNHSFISRDGQYKLSLTKNFIALSTVKYSCWDDFAAWLDEPLGQFINVYEPAYFERIGLRYVNAFSREKLSLEGARWSELIDARYLGVLSDDGVDEQGVTKCSVDIERSLDHHCKLKLHSGPGYIKRNVRTGDTVSSIQEKESRFILDEDLYIAGNIDLRAAIESLGTLHGYADDIFCDAISDKLHNAMEPKVSY